jgi:hypothetical protein
VYSAVLLIYCLRVVFLCVCFLCFGFIFVIICSVFFFLTSRNFSVEKNNQQNYISFKVNIFHWLMRLDTSRCNAVKGLSLIRKI